MIFLEQEILKMAASQGFFAVLFVGLLFYVLRNNEKREERLLSCLDNLGAQYQDLSKNMGEVKDDVRELKEKVEK